MGVAEIAAERDRDSLDAEFGFGACTVSEGEFGYTVKVRNRRCGRTWSGLGVEGGGTPETGDVGGRSKIEGRDGRRLASAFKGCAPSELRRLDFGEVPVCDSCRRLAAQQTMNSLRTPREDEIPSMQGEGRVRARIGRGGYKGSRLY